MKPPYFHDCFEYPGSSIATGCGEGIWYEYVASSYLEGVVNLTTPVLALKLDRYQDHDEQEFQATIGAMQAGYHTKLRDFGDDVLLLAEIRHPYEDRSSIDRIGAPRRYFLFWFDADVSDCCLGWFETDAPDASIRAHVLKWTGHLVQDVKSLQGFHDIPLTALKGWLTF